ncbi:hypothetical protein PDESU_05607 [Pontiella desulfatans]|uniref:Uncharacterized protein n=1 Tax=Pontiella desulfatans TaxID=2750659 RepID=A0A6C2UAX8_PONDE|nr:hypothetical protein [Pontiella desulfatans]VGO17013.1 hypothetical protein PDESU_05607 [Pontiella desulfatans]
MNRTLKVVLTFVATILVPVVAMFAWSLLVGGVALAAGLMVFGRVLVRTLPPLDTPGKKWALFLVSFILFFAVAFVPCLFYYLDLFYILGLTVWGSTSLSAFFWARGEHRHKTVILHLALLLAFIAATVAAYCLYESGWERITFD